VAGRTGLGLAAACLDVSGGREGAARRQDGDEQRRDAKAASQRYFA
jgi:hypothetical protein